MGNRNGKKRLFVFNDPDGPIEVKVNVIVDFARAFSIPRI
jgi:hypothetical protein